MTTKDYLKKLKSAQGVLAESEGANFTDSMMEITEIWSNDSCIGYFLCRVSNVRNLNNISFLQIFQNNFAVHVCHISVGCSFYNN